MSGTFRNNKNIQVSRFSTQNYKHSSGIGHIIIPKDYDRDKYILDCGANGTISILTENNERLDNLNISKNLLNDIEFPLNYQSLGSCVGFINIPIQNQGIVVAILTKKDETNVFREFTFSFKKQSLNSIVSLLGDAKEGTLILDVNTLNKNIDGGILIRVNNPENRAKIKLESAGNIDLFSKGDINLSSSKSINLSIIDTENEGKTTSLSYSKDFGFKYKDEFNNEFNFSKEYVSLVAEKVIRFGEAKEGATLGDTCKKMFDEFIDSVSNITTTTALGQMPILNKAQVILLKEKTENIISKYFLIQ